MAITLTASAAQPLASSCSVMCVSIAALPGEPSHSQSSTTMARWWLVW